MTNVDRRIEALESEVRELRAQLAQTKAPVLPKAKTVDPNAGEVGVYTTAPINRSFVMPNETQLAELLDIATRRFPVLRAGISSGRFAYQDEEVFRREYEIAFRALGSIHRMSDGVNEKWSADHWTRHTRSPGSAVRVLPFAAAVVAHGDIPFLFNPAGMLSSAFGLIEDGTGVVATDKWRHVLATNSTRESLPMPVSRAYGVGMGATVR